MSVPSLPAHREEAKREKNLAALSSVIAAIFLTSMKIVVGILTGSLGILAEAAHSALDLVAAAVTFFAVRFSSRPPDSKHTYGHGKVENLSALFETLLLLLTCVWIFYEAINRLFFKEVHVEATIWAFIVMAVSILIDVSRSRLLSRVAKKYDSQALEADALHFSTDIWSSSVVIGGLGLIWLSGYLRIEWLAQADSVAAMVVALIVVYVSVQLGRKAIGDLLDEIPDDLPTRVAKAALIPGVQKVAQVRVRRSGPEYFVDMLLEVNRSASSEEAHKLSEQAEAAVHQIIPGASVLIHVDPVRAADEKLIEAVRATAGQVGMGAHNVLIRSVDNSQVLTLHVDVPADMTLDQAHARATTFETLIMQAYPQVQQVFTHLEPAQRQPNGPVTMMPVQDRMLEDTILHLPSELGLPCEIRDVTIYRQDGRFDLIFQSLVTGETPMFRAHEITEKMETYLRQSHPDLRQVVIHIEPSAAN